MDRFSLITVHANGGGGHRFARGVTRALRPGDRVALRAREGAVALLRRGPVSRAGDRPA